MSEFSNLVLLVLLYGMQGVPLGLCLGAMCVPSCATYNAQINAEVGQVY